MPRDGLDQRASFFDGPSLRARTSKAKESMRTALIRRLMDKNEWGAGLIQKKSVGVERAAISVEREAGKRPYFMKTMGISIQLAPPR